MQLEDEERSRINTIKETEVTQATEELEKWRKEQQQLKIELVSQEYPSSPDHPAISHSLWSHSLSLLPKKKRFGKKIRKGHEKHSKFFSDFFLEMFFCCCL